MLEIFQNIVGVAPEGCEQLQYAFCCIAVLLVIILFFKLIISFSKNIFGKERRL